MWSVGEALKQNEALPLRGAAGNDQEWAVATKQSLVSNSARADGRSVRRASEVPIPPRLEILFYPTVRRATWRAWNSEKMGEYQRSGCNRTGEAIAFAFVHGFLPHRVLVQSEKSGDKSDRKNDSVAERPGSPISSSGHSNLPVTPPPLHLYKNKF
ncbi:hypothetical protein [Paenibacillus terrigena]|uniref:hypothetical protein n=1 Tax=Paenibacillus terrigena TaxID=369333 RepID=UPI0028D86E3A|nr:hypothetical protein [Paenibacillus terrigena]